MSDASSQNPDVPESEQSTTEQRPAANTMRPATPGTAPGSAPGGSTPPPAASRVVADSNPPAPEPASPPPPPSSPPPPVPSVSPLSGASAAIPGIPDDRPELKAAAAFGGGLVFALLLKRLAR